VVVDGRFYSALGNHCGADGDAYVTRFDPATERLETLGSVLGAVDHHAGAWGYGKVHAQMVRGSDGAVYAATYWGSTKGLAYADGYEGDVLLRVDPATGALASLGVPVARHGIPSLAGWAPGQLLYGEAPDPEGGASGSQKTQPGTFFVYDTAARRVVFSSDAGHAGYRSILVDARGRAYFSAGEKRMRVWDPGTRKLSDAPFELPGLFLRAATEPGPDGSVYGVTDKPAVLFALRPSGALEVLGPARGYTASLALDRSGRRLYYVPDAHGSSWREDTPLIAVDTVTGADDVVVKLDPLTRRAFDLRAGGSYDVVADPTRDRVFVGVNASTDESGFGEVLLLMVDLV
jgi:hypothetical protein